VTDRGRLQVRRAGQRVVFIGDGPGLVLDQVKDKPGLYRGTLRARFKVQGQSCSLRRDFSARLTGE